MAAFREVLGATRELASIVPAVLKLVVNAPGPDDVDNIAMRLAATAARSPDRTALRFEGRGVTYAELDAETSRIAQALKAEGIAKGNCVSLLMENRLEFVSHLFGISRAGASVALINTNLRGAQLIHCINTTQSKKLVFGSEAADAVATAKEESAFREGKDYLCVRDGEEAPTPNWAVDFAARVATTEPIPANEIPEVQRKEHALFIFTSGTTGMPKAAIQSQQKIVTSMGAITQMGFKTSADDRLYLCLPLYHGTGLLIGLLPAIEAGATVVLRRKFSASRFLDEVRAENCNAFIYIGELCRYLLAQPEHPDDGDNPLSKISGNGLRPDIWMRFKTRFGIERVYEFYAASEGNTGFMNLFNRDLTVGVAISPPALVEYDVRNDEIVRGDDGFCRRIEAGGVGLLLGRITERTAFDGYTDRSATEQKILRDVFEEGDAFFNTGDLITEVDAGFAFGLKHYQFVDRVGDTFRWKAENCSTNEIGEIINAHPSVEICNVYGVLVPGTDGRAGMAALVLSEGTSLDLEALSEHVHANLAAYSRPVFLRVLPELELTGTFKLVKGDLREAAYHPDRCPDPVYVLKPASNIYEPLDKPFYERIMAGDAGY